MTVSKIPTRFLLTLILVCGQAFSYAAKPSPSPIHCNAVKTDSALSSSSSLPRTAPANWQVKVHNTYPHRSNAFTQGLIVHQEQLFESTGHYGQSSISQININSGEIIQQRALNKNVFGEGITIWNNELIQLTWKSGQVYRYSLPDFSLLQTQTISGEGWGLTHNNQSLISSNGSAQLSFRDPISLAVESTLNVTYLGRPLKNLNELEWVNGCILANIWQNHSIAIIDPSSGQTTGLIDLSRIVAHEQKTGTSEVANGIAWLAESQRLLITGKYWQRIYEIELVKTPASK